MHPLVIVCLQASQQAVAAAPGRSPFEMLDALSEWHAVLGRGGIVSYASSGGVEGGMQCWQRIEVYLGWVGAGTGVRPAALAAADVRAGTQFKAQYSSCSMHFGLQRRVRCTTATCVASNPHKRIFGSCDCAPNDALLSLNCLVPVLRCCVTCCSLCPLLCLLLVAPLPGGPDARADDCMTAGLCMYRQDGLWTYEVCHKKHVRQFRQVRPLAGCVTMPLLLACCLYIYFSST